MNAMLCLFKTPFVRGWTDDLIFGDWRHFRNVTESGVEHQKSNQSVYLGMGGVLRRIKRIWTYLQDIEYILV